MQRRWQVRQADGDDRDLRSPLIFTPKALFTVQPDQTASGSLALYLDVVALQ